MAKSEVYSWRIDPELKAAIEEAARREGVSMARLLEQVATEWLSRRRGPDDEDEQQRLHDAAARCIGKIRGGDPHRSREASRRVREKLRKRRGS